MKRVSRVVSALFLALMLLLGVSYRVFAQEGTQMWAFTTGSFVVSSPAIGRDNTIYVGSSVSLYAMHPNGTLKWAFPTGGGVTSSPAIGSDGTIYVGSNDDYLYAIYGDSGGLALSSWPMFHHDLRHTGRVATTAMPWLPLLLFDD